jgi:[acyl-carrier-protein] S-malonyltransferase
MKIGMMFPDCGSQFVGMAKELYDNSRLIQEYFEEGSSCLNVNLVKLCFAASDAELARIENAYCTIFLVGLAIADFLKEQGIVPQVVAGYGIGEFSAIAGAGGLSLPDGLYFLNKYAQFFQEALGAWKVGMIKVEEIKSTQLRRLCEQMSDASQQVYIAAYNSSQEHLVAGHAAVLEPLGVEVRKLGGTVGKERVERGLHCEIMEPVVAQLKKYLTKIDFKDLKVPLLAGVDGMPVEKGDLVRRRVMKQLQAPVMWEKVMKQAADVDVFIEIGPGTTLSRFIRDLYPTKALVAINKLSDIHELQNLLKSKASGL